MASCKDSSVIRLAAFVILFRVFGDLLFGKNQSRWGSTFGQNSGT